MKLNKAIFIMGVSGCGKSTVGQLLSQELNIPFYDGDDYHPKVNIAKMSKGNALTDDDRHVWLVTLNKLAKEQLKKDSCVIVCSALKEKYRDLLRKDIESRVEWVHLNGSFDQIKERINNRSNHFMNSDLLKSQFDTLENPVEALNIDIDLTPKEIVKTIVKELTNKSEFGLYGLGVMGKSLSRNLARNGFKVSLFNRHVDGLEENIAADFIEQFDELSAADGFDDVEEFVNSLQKPRKIMLMVNAGKTIDLVIEGLIPYLSEGDIIIDGGNANYLKTKERFDYLRTKDIHFIGTGVSGGEEGALLGPSIMPSGDKKAYKLAQAFLEKIAAKDENNLPCCTYIGSEGSGHFVKMVHNGIEYAEMQLLAEVFSVLSAAGNNPDEIANIFEDWKETANSYLLEITIEILRKKENDEWLVNKILDKAGNKGTGNWATIASAELGAPSTLIASALFARYTSFYKEDRLIATSNFRTKNQSKIEISSNELLSAYQFARIINHYQGFNLINQASKFYKWELNLSEIARIWTSGCIIKSDLMKELVAIFRKTDTILNDKKFIETIKSLKASANKIVSESILKEIPIPCLSESVNFFNGYTTANSSANLIQAQRDFFGAHTYQRIDDKTGKFYHTNWQ